MSEVIIVDRRTDRAINRTYLPKGIDLAKLHAFLRAHQVGFYSLDVFSERAGWARHPDEFRVATHDFPSRGVNTSFDKVREWLAGLEKCDIQESEAIGALLSALEERAVNAGLVRDRKRVGEGKNVSERGDPG